MTRPDVSILLVTRDGMPHLPRLLDRLDQQQTALTRELVAVDSGSTDGSRELLAARCDVVLDIAPDRFNHGLTRNLGISRCRGELVVLLVQDALPASERWLEQLVAPLRADARVAGTYARQLPRTDASPVTRYYHDRWAAASPLPRRATVETPEAFGRLAPEHQHRICVFDNVCSCIRRAVWADHPFAQTAIAEDLTWAKEVLLAGHQLLYVPEAVVIHSHDRPASYELRRTYLVHRRLHQLFGLRAVPSLPALAWSVASATRTHLRCVASDPVASRSPRELARALGLALAWPLGQYLGALSAARGWRDHRLGAI